mmetsp:Transcript_1194/g.1947  ORF Transcript_1194/g.1947 Transcript_1194/m.1947 type:complete len:85 (-) Transcript_1194:38-292(-)
MDTNSDWSRTEATSSSEYFVCSATGDSNKHQRHITEQLLRRNSWRFSGSNCSLADSMKQSLHKMWVLRSLGGVWDAVVASGVPS